MCQLHRLIRWFVRVGSAERLACSRGEVYNRSMRIRHALLLLFTVIVAASVYAGATVPGIDIVLVQKPGGKAVRARSDGNGNFEVKGLAPGSYTLTVRSDRRATDGNERARIGLRSAPAPRFLIDIPDAATPRVVTADKLAAGVSIDVKVASGSSAIRGRISPAR